MAKNILKPFQLLELNVISAQDLAQISRRMRTYAIAWVHPDRKLSTRVDTLGHNNPTWNDKFVFRVDDEFLSADTSAVMIEIYALHWFRDIHVGTVRVIVGNLVPPSHPHNTRHLQLGMRFVALQVRRPSGRPQGILNIGVALLDSSMRSMPLYSQLNASAVGYRHLMGEEDPHMRKDDDKSSDDDIQFLLPWISKPELRRTKSENSSMFGSMKKAKGSSIFSGSDVDKKRNNKRSKASSMISGFEIVRGDLAKKPVSFHSGSDLGALAKAKYGSEVIDIVPNKKQPGSDNENPFYKFNGLNASAYAHGTPKRPDFNTGKTDVSESDLGPSPSELAAAVANINKNHPRVEETESDIMGGWSLESSMEGLQSKLERWRAELPPQYDRGELSSFPISKTPVSSIGRGGHARRHTGDHGSFSCFGRICGLECSIVCGGSSMRKKKGGGPDRSHSMDNLSFL